ncbi:calcium-activated chloride channel-domain-containing protein [Apiospora kogelbergensis]|uniref:calcium-activated chloride channel-domain-containing protein n=1 Tax=Apiospora kogelbergensis TaxID=1337665 RepID=UPI00312E4391
MFSFKRQGTFGDRDQSILHRTFHDKYVVHYDFSDVDDETAKEEFSTLVADLEEAGLQTEVRAGADHSLLVFVRAPTELLNDEMHKSRVKDWLWGITSEQPQVGRRDQRHALERTFEAEGVLSVYHLVNWQKEQGGAAITPGYGKWTNVKSIFPIHNGPANKELLKHLSQKMFLTKEDFDKIRDLFGAKVAFYFAYMQTYLLFLTFPAVTGILAWAFLPKYSLVYAIVTLLGCTIFLEYWKIQQDDLSIRWNVRGVGSLKQNRPKYHYEKVIVDSAGRKKHYYPRWKAILRQLAQIPFFALAVLVLGLTITAVYAMEIILSEAYQGPYQSYLEYVPTLVLAACLPYTRSFLEDVATALADFENHRTADYYEMSVTQKTFVLSFIVQYFPILLTAFVYVPLGGKLVPYLQTHLPGYVGQKLNVATFEGDTDRLRNEVIALTVTGQVSDMFEEMVMPYLMHKLRGWWHQYKFWNSNHGAFQALAPDDPAEEPFLRSVRQQASLEPYNVQDDISEMVIQFGYLALFAPVWPLVSVGFFINNLIELRSDFLKICLEHQRPHPIRMDGIGPWMNSLDSLTWMGSICTAAIVHMFGTQATGHGGTTLLDRWGGVTWWSLPITIFLSEHIFLLLRWVVRLVLQKVGSEQIRRERNERYAARKKHLEDLEQASKTRNALDVGLMERRKSVRMADPDLFWTKQAREGVSDIVGVKLIEALGRTRNGGLPTKED